MQQNIKVDMVYYRTPSDFEMEFNLCGCCHMRLLSEKAQDRQSLIRSLARAVSRSRIIIACGPLFDKDGLIPLVAAAIGTKTQQISNRDYGINSEGYTDIIKGSTPLVTPDGFFCGCIIESGPQSIIILSDNRDLRKQILKELIHPYIYELSTMPEPVAAAQNDNTAPEEENSAFESEENPSVLKETEETVPEHAEGPENSGTTSGETAVDVSADSLLPDASDADAAASIAATVAKITASIAMETEKLKNETAASISEIPTDIAGKAAEITKPEKELTEQSEETEDTKEQTEPNTKSSNEISFVMDDPEEDEEEYPNEEFEQDDVMNSLYIEPSAPTPASVAQYASEYTPSKGDELFISGDDEESWDFDYDGDGDQDRDEKKKASNLSISIIAVSVILVLIIVALAYILVYIPYSKGIGMSTYIHQIFGTSSSMV